MKRWANERDTLKYVSLIEKGNSAIVEQTEIDLKSEFVFLGLRLAKGIDVDEYKNRFGVDLLAEYAEDLQRLKETELIETCNNRLKLTKKGFLFSNEVFAVFV